MSAMSDSSFASSAKEDPITGPMTGTTNGGEVNDLMKCRIDHYNISEAVSELNEVVSEAAELYQQVKKMKFDYLGIVCEIYSKLDYPSFMIDSCEKQIRTNIPLAKDLKQRFDRYPQHHK